MSLCISVDNKGQYVTVSSCFVTNVGDAAIAGDCQAFWIGLHFLSRALFDHSEIIDSNHQLGSCERFLSPMLATVSNFCVFV